MGPNTKVENDMRNETAETCTIDGESPVVEPCSFTVWLPSSMGHVKSRMNSRGPPRKTKYSQVTDSEKYREGKMKRTILNGVKQNMNPYVYNQWEDEHI